MCLKCLCTIYVKLHCWKSKTYRNSYVRFLVPKTYIKGEQSMILWSAHPLQNFSQVTNPLPWKQSNYLAVSECPKMVLSSMKLNEATIKITQERTNKNLKKSRLESYYNQALLFNCTKLHCSSSTITKCSNEETWLYLFHS